MMILLHLIPGLAVPGTAWHLAGLPERLPWTGEVVEFDRLAGAVKVQAATNKLQVEHVNPRERRPTANTVDGYG